MYRIGLRKRECQPDPTGYWPSKYKYDFYIRGTAYGLEPYGGRVRDTARDNPR